MGYSLRVPLPGGKLKIKSKSRLRPREAEGKVPMLRFLGLYVIWDSDEQHRRDRGPPIF